MAITNQERIGKAMELLQQGLAPFVEREFKSLHEGKGAAEVLRYMGDDRIAARKPLAEWDVAALLKLMWEAWNEVFRNTLGRAERSLVQELRDSRNKWAHQEPFSSDDADRSLDSMARLLTAVSASQADEVTKMKMELRRLTFDEQVRSEKRKSGGSLIETGAASTLKPWREVVTPHADVASGRYQQAEFAADLWQVHLGEGSDEYRKPAEFFRRTFLTESLKRLLVGGVQRIAGTGGDPVVQLQTNFGGGKTHSMLALYHLFSGVNPSELAGVDAVLAEAGVKTLPKARRVVLVGNKISPGNPVTKPDGTVVHTLWGELAYQLGGKKAYARIAKDDEKATSPGDVLRELFVEHGPCLVLIDEWVAYARQLHDQSDLPAGGFETMFTFAQALTESAKLAKNCLLVVSLPASDTSGSPHTATDDVEVGGIRGREALDRLRNVVGRVESSWRPATAEEGFEIVRRRLFEPLVGTDAFKQRDVTARAFSDLYHAQSAEFPAECKGSDYEKRIQAAYPIHPEIFDRLYTDWSTLVKFQRTRGVLRLMAAVIHSLWEKGDRNPLILPSTIPIDDGRVQSELTRYLSDNWAPIIEKDVDGPSSLPLKIDNEVPNLGKLHATRRVARTIYLGSAPTTAAAHRGLEDRRVKLGCVMPGESPAVFGDALRRLAAAATYLYQDGPRAWYATQPTVTKLAEDRADQLKRDPDKAAGELDARLRADLKKTGDFSRVHPLPRSGADVPDDLDARLVVLPAEHPYSKESGNPAELAAKAILESRGNTPRLYRNTLVFLAADKVRLQDLDEALRKYLAWASILEEKLTLNLDPHQVRQAETQMKAADGAVTARLPETYQWVLVPEQKTPQAPVEWTAVRLSGSDALAVRATKRLRADELLVTALGSTILKKHLDDVPLWRGEHVTVKQLVEDFGRYLYLPRLAGPEVLVQASRDGVAMLTWQADTFAYAESHDEAAGRYQRSVVLLEHVSLVVLRSRRRRDSRAGPLCRFVQSAEYDGRGRRFAEVVVSPDRFRKLSVLWRAVGAAVENEWQRGEPLFLANLEAKPEAVHVGHEDVRNDAVHAFPIEDFKRLDAVGGFEHAVSFGLQLRAQQLEIGRVIVNDEENHVAARLLRFLFHRSVLSLAKSLEDKDAQSKEAEAAYLEVLKAGDPQSRAAAQEGLARISRAKDSGNTAVLEAAKALEEVRRWEDSEALYRQVLQSGSLAQRQVALAKIKKIADVRNTFREKHFAGVWKAFVPIVVSVAILLLVLVPLAKFLKWFFRRRYRDRLSIGDFGSSQGKRSSGDTFGETLTVMHERMATHSRPRTLTSTTVDLVKGCAEDVMPDLERRSVDLIFSSPPYFNVERYSSEPTQSYHRYPTYDTWKERFLYPVLAASHRLLRPSGLLIINLADTSRHPIATDMIAMASRLYRKRRVLKLLMHSRPEQRSVTNGTSYRWEPVFVLQKA